MTKKSEVIYIDISNKQDLVKYYNKLAILFEQSFEKPLDKAMWEWAYIHNPYGDPFVSLAICDDKIVGHYAVIPYFLENKQGEIHSYLSMTTMVSPDFRGQNLFTILAERVYDQIDALELPSFVFGFPNDNSAPGFVRKLGWTVFDQYKVYNVSKKNINKAIDLINDDVDEKSFTVNFTDKKYLQWRSNKPNQTWTLDNGLGIKYFDGGADLMYISDLSNVNFINDINSINIILPKPTNAGLLGEELFHYRFGYRAFNFDGKQPTFFVQMAMSDVF
jgi:N-acetylglutamate synthase-like GNAT family acetyltransferase